MDLFASVRHAYPPIGVKAWHPEDTATASLVSQSAGERCGLPAMLAAYCIHLGICQERLRTFASRSDVPIGLLAVLESVMARAGYAAGSNLEWRRAFEYPSRVRFRSWRAHCALA